MLIRPWIISLVKKKKKKKRSFQATTDQIFLRLGGNAVATKQPPAGWNKEYNFPYIISLRVLANKECIFP